MSTPTELANLEAEAAAAELAALEVEEVEEAAKKTAAVVTVQEETDRERINRLLAPKQEVLVKEQADSRRRKQLQQQEQRDITEKDRIVNAKLDSIIKILTNQFPPSASAASFGGKRHNTKHRKKSTLHKKTKNHKKR